MSPFLLLLLICLSKHTCNAPSLGLGLLSDKEARKQVFTKDLAQDVNEMNLEKSLISWERMPSLSQEFGAQGQPEVGNDNRSTRESLLGASTMEYKHLLGFMKEKEGTKRNTLGHKDIVSSQNYLQQEAKIEGLKRQGRKILGSSHVMRESTAESKGNDNSMDIVVTDYAQAHRKPPIHNGKS